VVSRDDIGIHLGSELVVEGATWPGLVHTIDHPDGLVLVDTGMIDSTPEIEDMQPTPHPLPGELVSRVAIVVNTHLHFDHCGGNRLFPGVPIHVQRRELADARTQDDYTIREWVDFPGATYVEHDGEAKILPGVRLVPAPGHTEGHSDRRCRDRRGAGGPRRRRRLLVRGHRAGGHAREAARARARRPDLLSARP
jgi:N-acyl homoserine lactone hydrolase